MVAKDTFKNRIRFMESLVDEAVAAVLIEAVWKEFELLTRAIRSKVIKLILSMTTSNRERYVQS